MVEPVDKATYWDKALPTEERRAKAKRLIVKEATVESVVKATEEQSSEAVKPKKVFWKYVIEPVVKATYWDISLPTEERRAKAKRLTVQELTGESESSEASSEDAESDNEPIWKSGFSTKLAANAIGLKVARKIGKRGVLTGEIIAYNVAVNKYTVVYSDGDAQDYNEAEYLRVVHCTGIKNGKKRKPRMTCFQWKSSRLHRKQIFHQVQTVQKRNEYDVSGSREKRSYHLIIFRLLKAKA